MDSLGGILWNAIAFFESDTKLQLGTLKARLCCFEVPGGGLNWIGLHTFPVSIGIGQERLGQRVALPGCPLHPADRFGIVLFDPLALPVAIAKRFGRLDMALFGSKSQPLVGFGQRIVACIIWRVGKGRDNQVSQCELSVRVPLLGRKAKPLPRLELVFEPNAAI